VNKERELFLKRRRNQLLKENKLSLYDPYPFQVKFHNDTEDRVGLTASNQTGKTIAGCVQDAMDLTGRYPYWYEGFKYDKPIHVICGGVTDPKTRDILQKALLGNPVERESSWGTGWIPRDCLDKRKMSLKRGVTDAYAHVMVKHHTDGIHDGWSQLTFSSYAAGKEAWMGDTIDIYHGDEESPMDILAQMGRGCIATHGRIRMTFTPENGETDVLEKVREQWSHHEATFADVAGDNCSYEFDDGEILTLAPVYTLNGRVGHVTEKTMLKSTSSTSTQ
jgi:phage terminase large subunit-like protein